MKGSGALVASLAALASSVAFTASYQCHDLPFSNKVSSSENNAGSFSSRRASSASSNETDKFAPRFDGLRFIETLITAHR